MRYLFLTILLLGQVFSIASAAPYSHLESIAKQPKNLFLANTVLNKNEITYCLTTIAPSYMEKLDEHIEKYIQAAIREWTYGIALRIREAGRADEMADILPVLEKDIQITRLPKCNLSSHKEILDYDKSIALNADAPIANITIIAAKDYCYQLRGEYVSFYSSERKGKSPFICLTEIDQEDSLRSLEESCYLPNKNTPQGEELFRDRCFIFDKVIAGKYDSKDQKRLWKLDRFFSYDTRTLFFTVTHELGHAFGLNDEYLSKRPSDYSTIEPGDGMMRRPYTAITCDEVDGIITLMDRFAENKRTFTSFCSSDKLIVNGTEQK